MSRINRNRVWDYAPVPSGIRTIPRNLRVFFADPLGHEIARVGQSREAHDELAASLTIVEGLRLMADIDDALPPVVPTTEFEQ